MANGSKVILLTGSTGYVGGRLLRALEGAGYHVRCLSRHPETLNQRVAHTTEVVKGDVLDAMSLPSNMIGVHTAYYLVHAMGSANSFEEEDRRSVQAFAVSARDAGVQRIIYLGGRLRHRVQGITRTLAAEFVPPSAIYDLSFSVLLRSLFVRRNVNLTAKDHVLTTVENLMS